MTRRRWRHSGRAVQDWRRGRKVGMLYDGRPFGDLICHKKARERRIIKHQLQVAPWWWTCGHKIISLVCDRACRAHWRKGYVMSRDHACGAQLLNFWRNAIYATMVNARGSHAFTHARAHSDTHVQAQITRSAQKRRSAGRRSWHLIPRQTWVSQQTFYPT